MSKTSPTKVWMATMVLTPGFLASPPALLNAELKAAMATICQAFHFIDFNNNGIAKKAQVVPGHHFQDVRCVQDDRRV